MVLVVLLALFLLDLPPGRRGALIDVAGRVNRPDLEDVSADSDIEEIGRRPP
jgi:hypothetical protein